MAKPLTIRTRKLIGAVVLIVFLLVYSLLVMVLAPPVLNTDYRYIAPVFFAFAGLLWLPPAAYIVWWMSQTGTQR